MKRGDGGESVHGLVFEGKHLRLLNIKTITRKRILHLTDENFAIEHNKRGIVGMANKGRHTNGSQFYVTLQATPWMDTKYVAFG